MPLIGADATPHPEQAPAPQDHVILVNDLSGGLDTITPLPLLPNAFCRDADGVVFTEGAIQTDIDCVDLPLAIWNLPAAGDDYHILIPVDTLSAGPSQVLLTTGGLYRLDSDGNPTVIHEGLKGDPEIRPSYTFMPSNDWLVITNGVDTPFYYDGTEVGFITSLSDTFGAFTARHVLSWNNLLFFIDTDEGGERKNYRIRRSDVADPTEWEEGLAGFTDLLDARDFVVGAKVLGPYLIIYRQNSLIRGEWIGLAHLLLDFNTVVPIDGPLNAEAIAQIDSTHIYAGRHGVYGYNGSLDVEHISYPISAQNEYPAALRMTGEAAVRVFAGVNRRVVTVMLPHKGAGAAPITAMTLRMNQFYYFTRVIEVGDTTTNFRFYPNLGTAPDGFMWSGTSVMVALTDRNIPAQRVAIDTPVQLLSTDTNDTMDYREQHFPAMRDITEDDIPDILEEQEMEGGGAGGDYTILYGVHIPKTSRLPVTWHKRTFDDIVYDDVGCYITTNPGVRWNELSGSWEDQNQLTWNDYRGSILNEKEDVFLSEDSEESCAYLRASMDRMRTADLDWSCETGFFSAYERDLRLGKFFMHYEAAHPIMIEFLDTNAPDAMAPASIETAVFNKSLHQETSHFRIRFSGRNYAKIVLYGVTTAANYRSDDTLASGA